MNHTLKRPLKYELHSGYFALSKLVINCKKFFNLASGRWLLVSGLWFLVSGRWLLVNLVDWFTG
jgi:hypothetical protein